MRDTYGYKIRSVGLVNEDGNIVEQLNSRVHSIFTSCRNLYSWNEFEPRDIKEFSFCYEEIDELSAITIRVEQEFNGVNTTNDFKI